MRIALAPMEGLVDDIMRDTLTRIGGLDWCVTEFIRVTDTLLPPRSYYRVSPELYNAARTRAGTPVRVQLLGSDAVCLAENAARAAELGAPVVDLNFGCPAKCVNRHRGGAVLLKEPELLHEIVATVRRAVPSHIPVTAKMRLGYEDKSLALDCARALEAGGAAEIVVHARTKVEGYKPPAHWHWIALIRQAVRCNVIANGEIWTVDDYLRCRTDSGCDDIMLGRGLVGRPDLALQIRARLAGQAHAPLSWQGLQRHVADFFEQVVAKVEPVHAPGRLKQWVGLLTRGYPEAEAFFAQVRALKSIDAISALLADTQPEALVLA